MRPGRDGTRRSILVADQRNFRCLHVCVEALERKIAEIDADL